MNDLGDYIYIVVMIIAVVVSIIKKNKSQQRVPSAPRQDAADDEQDPDVLAEFRDLFRDSDRDAKTLDTESDEEEELPKEQVAVTAQAPRTFIREDYFTYDAPSQAKPERGIITAAMEVEEEDEGRLVFDKEMDIRQAIIYAEILKRPAY